MMNVDYVSKIHHKHGLKNINLIIIINNGILLNNNESTINIDDTLCNNDIGNIAISLLEIQNNNRS